jgi:DNA-binding protein HU-beta
MNKTELIDAITQATDLSKVAAGKAVDAMLAAIGKSLQGGDSVVLTGFGTFSVRERPARTGHNPKTGEPWRSRPASLRSSRLVKPFGME